MLNLASLSLLFFLRNHSNSGFGIRVASQSILTSFSHLKIGYETNDLHLGIYLI